MSQKKRNNYAITTDESGNKVDFILPHAALYFDTGMVSCLAEEKIEAGQARLFEKAFKQFDHTEVLIHDLDDKMKVVNRLKKTGRWV